MPKPPIRDENDFHLLLSEARLLSLKFKHGFIHYSHMYVAMLTTNCKANGLCSHSNSREWTDWLQKQYPDDGTNAVDASLPLTVAAELAIRHATSIAQKTEEPNVNSVHLLLAILSFSSEVSKSFDQAGITFEEIVAAYGQKPFKKFPPEIPSVRPAPAWSRWFKTAATRKQTVEQAHSTAALCLQYTLNDQCISACQIGLSADPENKELSYFMMEAYLNKRAFQEALTFLLAFLDQSPKDKNLRVTLGYIYDELGEYAKAEPVLDQLLAEFPEDDTVLNNAGINRSHQQRYAEAVVLLEKAIAINPAFAYPWNNLGFAKCKLGQITEGLTLIEKSLELDKGNSYAYKNKGIIFFEQGQNDEAVKNFQLALKFGYQEKYGNEVAEYLEKIRYS